MSSHVVFPVLIAFAISVVLGPVVIPFLRKLKMKQTERVDGVQSHLKKAGTPTMGGIIILAAVIITSLFSCERLSEDHTGSVPDRCLRSDRVPGRLPEGCPEAVRWSAADAEDGASDCSYGNICLLHC